MRSLAQDGELAAVFASLHRVVVTLDAHATSDMHRTAKDTGQSQHLSWLPVWRSERCGFGGRPVESTDVMNESALK
jgi:hypothetical protein